MKKGTKIKPEEIIAILRQVEVMISQGKTVPMACRDSAITEQTYYRWRKQYGGMQVPQAKENIYFLFTVKCKLIAESINVPIGKSIVKSAMSSLV